MTIATERFEVVLADDEWGRRLHHQLRYQVFCMETGYEDASQFPDGEEKDVWDTDSAHFLVRSVDSGHWVAAMRCIFPTGSELPIERKAKIDPTLRPPQGQYAEISRLCMMGHYRRRLQGHVGSCSDSSAAEDDRDIKRPDFKQRRRMAEMLRVLLKAAMECSFQRDVRYWYMLVTPALARVLGQVLPMHLQSAGEPCWHRGERHPFLVDLHQVALELMATSPDNTLFGAEPCYRLHSELMDAMPQAVVA